MTKNIFLRISTYKLLYKADGKTLFKHEHIIFMSNYFIRKLQNALHYYIDDTFIHTPGFKQIIIIMYLDLNFNKRYPALFCLMNNKNKEGYIEIFNEIKKIITIENTTNLKLESISLDFEIGIIEAIQIVFPNVNIIGCYFHFMKNLRKKANNLHLLTDELKDQTNNLLKELSYLPYTYKKISIY